MQPCLISLVHVHLFGRAGEWRADKRHGNGTMVWPDGRRFQGQWDHDVMVGGVDAAAAGGDGTLLANGSSSAAAAAAGGGADCSAGGECGEGGGEERSSVESKVAAAHVEL